MSHKFWRVLWLMVFLLAAMTGGAGLSQAQPAKPTTPDQQPREILNQSLHVVLPPADSQPAQKPLEANSPDSPAGLILNEDFEGAWPTGAWMLADFSDMDGGEYLWDDRRCTPHTGDWAAYSVGGGADGSNLACLSAYPNNVFTWAMYGPFNLSSATAATLTYHFTGSVEGGANCPWDRFFVGHSANGEDYNGSSYCGNWTGGSDGNGYNLRTLDLAPRLGDGSVWVAFVLLADSTQTDIGIMIDDLSLDVTTSCDTPNTPSLIAPANGALLTDTTPTFTWNSVSNANEYAIEVDDSPDFISPIIQRTPTATSFTAPSALAAGTYYWRVRAHNTAGGCAEFGPWSVTQMFTISSGPTCYLLTLNKGGQGSAPTASPAASSGCANGRYIGGQMINLTASPASGWRVGSWQGTNNNGSTANTNVVTMPAAAHIVRVNYIPQTGVYSQAALPFVIYGLTGFLGPLEVEPNSTLGEANGPILLNRTYQGYPNDLSDYYYVDLTTTRQLNITLTGITGTDPQLHLYRDSSANRVGYDPDAPYAISYNAPPGRYWVRVVVVGNYNTSSLYTLRVNAP